MRPNSPLIAAVALCALLPAAIEATAATPATAPTPAATAAPAAPATGLDWLTTVAAARAAAAKNGQYILVDLYAEWCGWCRKLESSVFSTPQFKEFAHDFVRLRVDVEDRGEGAALRQRYGADTLPTMLILDARMVKAGAVRGFSQAPIYVNRLKGELEKFRALEPIFAMGLESDDWDTVRRLADELHGRYDGVRAARLYRRLTANPAAELAIRVDNAYLLVDSLRLAEDFAGARQELRGARELARKVGESGAARLEQLDLLAVKIAGDEGDCRQTVLAIETFLREHPASDAAGPARRQLESLKSEGGAQCS